MENKEKNKLSLWKRFKNNSNVILAVVTTLGVAGGALQGMFNYAINPIKDKIEHTNKRLDSLETSVNNTNKALHELKNILISKKSSFPRLW